MRMIGAILHALDRLLAPPICPACEAELAPPDGHSLGHDCADALPRLPEKRCDACGGPNDTMMEVCHDCADNPRPWFRGVSALPYHGLGGDLVRAYKFGRRTSIAPFLAHEMALAWRDHGSPARPRLIVPVPLHWTRRLQRGFNQTELLGSFLARELGIPLVACLARRHATAHQARLSGDERLRNLRHAFVPRRTGAFRNRSVLLIDDVFTTGATLTAATEALLKAGAAEVSVLTATRA